MIGLDTNILVRLLVRDDPAQFEAATRFVNHAVARTESLFVNRIVLTELAWVLSRAYRLSRPEIADAIEHILMTAELDVEESDVAWEALRDYRSGAADFADCLIGTVNRARGCTTTMTFERECSGLSPFTLLKK